MRLPPSPNPDDSARSSAGTWQRVVAVVCCFILLGYGFIHWGLLHTNDDGSIDFNIIPSHSSSSEQDLEGGDIGDSVKALQDKVDEYEVQMSATLSTFVSDCPYRAAIVYLVKNTQISNLLLSISLLLRNVPFHCAYPIILLHDGDFRELEAQRVMRDQLMLVMMNRLEEDGNAAVARYLEALNGIEFVELEFTLPQGVSSNVTEVDPVFPNVWPGYHEMCRFFFAEITEHPRIRDLDYYLRLDTDSFILSKLAYDPVHLLFARNRSYGFIDVGTDPPLVTEGFFPFVRSYADSHADVRDRMERNGWEYPEHERPWMYQNNFEVMHVPSFRTAEVREWVDTVLEDPLRILKYRWGDAPLRYATVQMFFDVKRDVERFCDITYFHQGLHDSCAYGSRRSRDGRRTASHRRAMISSHHL